MISGYLKIICSWCQSETEMAPHRLWWNFDDETYADPIGYCSELCISYARVQKEAMRNELSKKYDMDVRKMTDVPGMVKK